jgi:hypothetical protein
MNPRRCGRRPGGWQRGLARPQRPSAAAFATTLLLILGCNSPEPFRRNPDGGGVSTGGEIGFPGSGGAADTGGTGVGGIIGSGGSGQGGTVGTGGSGAAGAAGTAGATGGSGTGGAGGMAGGATGGRGSGGTGVGGIAGSGSGGRVGTGGAGTGGIAGAGIGGAGTGGAGTGGAGTGGAGTGGAGTGGAGTGGSIGGTGPCMDLCANPLPAPLVTTITLGVNATCHESIANIADGNCGNFVAPRTFTVNSVVIPVCTATMQGGTWPLPLPPRRNGGYCFQASAGQASFAYFSIY